MNEIEAIDQEIAEIQALLGIQAQRQPLQGVASYVLSGDTKLMDAERQQDMQEAQLLNAMKMAKEQKEAQKAYQLDEIMKNKSRSKAVMDGAAAELSYAKDVLKDQRAVDVAQQKYDIAKADYQYWTNRSGSDEKIEEVPASAPVTEENPVKLASEKVDYEAALDNGFETIEEKNEFMKNIEEASKQDEKLRDIYRRAEKLTPKKEKRLKRYNLLKSRQDEGYKLFGQDLKDFEKLAKEFGGK